jgi:hypothetical protein
MHNQIGGTSTLELELRRNNEQYGEAPTTLNSYAMHADRQRGRELLGTWVDRRTILMSDGSSRLPPESRLLNGISTSPSFSPAA